MNSARTRILIVVGIVIAAFNLRPGVTGLSPLLDAMGEQIHLSAAFLAIIGMLPPLLYGLSGFITPRLYARFSGLGLTLAAMTMVAIGLGARSVIDSPALFLALSVLALLGMGIGNVVLPPLVKSYFPDRVALMSTVHVGLLQFGTFIPPLVAVPLATGFGWRGSLLVWAGFGVVGVAVWILIRLIRPAPATEVAAAVVGGSELARLMRSKRAWALMTMTGLTSFNNFILFTWLPSLLTRSGFDAAFAGAMLALVTAIPLVLGFVLPALAQKMASAYLIVVGFCLSLAVGYIGLWLLPTVAPVLWTVLLGNRNLDLPAGPDAHHSARPRRGIGGVSVGIRPRRRLSAGLHRPAHLRLPRAELRQHVAGVLRRARLGGSEIPRQPRRVPPRDDLRPVVSS